MSVQRARDDDLPDPRGHRLWPVIAAAQGQAIQSSVPSPDFTAAGRAGESAADRPWKIETLRWVTALLVAAGFHIGAIAWMLRSQPVALADSEPPAAIMVEFVQAPEAVKTERNDITPDQTTTQESVAQQERKSEEATEKKPVERAPEPEVTEPVEKEPLPVEKEPPPVEAETPMPADQPKPEPPKKEPPKKEPPKKEPPKKEPPKKEAKKEKPQPRKQDASQQSTATNQAQARVQQSNRTAAAQTASGVASVSPATWQSQLMAHLERRKRYPPGAQSRGERGIVYVRFTIDASGNVQSVTLSRSSGHAELDQEVLALVRRASPVPAPPPGVQRDIIAPVRFSGS